jgi:hypothetical protein
MDSRCVHGLLAVGAACAVLLAGCGPVPFARMGGAGSVNVSFIGQAAPVGKTAGPAGTAKAYQIHPLGEETYFKNERKQAVRGSLRASYTPAHFLLDLTSIWLYNTSVIPDFDQTAELLDRAGTPYGSAIPQHYDLVYARDIIRDLRVNNGYWMGFGFNIEPFCGGNSDNCYIRSVAGVDLGAEYASVDLPGEVTELREGTVHYFAFDFLQPYACPFLGYLFLGADVAAAGLQNPAGEMGDWTAPGVSTGGNSSQIFLPGPAIDLTMYTNPSATYYWDMQDLVEVYDAGTPGDLADDVVTFAIANPVPVSLVIEEKSGEDGASLPDDDVPPGEVMWPEVQRWPDWNILQWVNPTDEDFDRTIVVGKAGSPPSGMSDGSVVYEGYQPCFCDASIGTTTRYYRICTVDRAGNRSAGVSF